MKRHTGAVISGVMLCLSGALVGAQTLTIRADRFGLLTGPCVISSGATGPESVVTGAVCDRFMKTNGTYWVKTSGSGNTGWTQVGWAITPAALTKVDDTNVTLTLGGTPATALLQATSITVNWANQLSLARGGTGANLTANTGGIFYSGASAGAILSGTATAGQMLRSGATAAPTWSTATWPNTATTTGAYLRADGTNWITSTLMLPNAATATYVPYATAANTWGESANLTFDASTLTLTGAQTVSGLLKHPSFASQTSNWGITAAGSADFRYLFTDELRAKLFTADLESVLAGAQVITKSYSTVSQTFTCPSSAGTTTMWVKDAATFGDAAVFVSGDWVVLHSMTRSAFGPFTITECVGAVTAYADGTGANAGQQSWTFTRGTGAAGGGMTGGVTVAVDQLVTDMGVTGNGVVETTAVDGAASVNAPYVQIKTWATAPVAANWTTRTRFGNLYGITGTANEYGLLAGTYAASDGHYFRASNAAFELHGIDLGLWDGATQTVKINHATPSIALGNPLPTAYGTGAGIWMGKDTSYKFRVGDPSGGQLAWDGTTLKAGGWSIGATALTDTAGVVGMSSAVTGGDDIRFWAGHATPGSAPFRVTEAGALTASNATISGGEVVLDSTGILVGNGSSYSTAGAVRFKPISGQTGALNISAWDTGGTRKLLIQNIANNTSIYTATLAQVQLDAAGWNDSGSASPTARLVLSSQVASSSLTVTATATTFSGKLGLGPGGAGTLEATLDVGNLVRVQSIADASLLLPASGKGIEIYYGGTSNIGGIISYDRTNSAYKRLDIQANPLVLGGGVGAVVVTNQFESQNLMRVRGVNGLIAPSTGDGLELYAVNDGAGTVYSGLLSYKRDATAGYTPLYIYALKVNIANGLTSYANNAAAVTGGLTAGDLYAITGSNPFTVAIVY